MIPFDPAKHAEDWEAFLPLTASGNLFQARHFVTYHPSDRLVDLSLVFRRRGRLVAVAAGELAGAVSSSHRFTSRAGLAVRRALQSGLLFGLSDHLRGSWKIPEASLEARFGVKPTHCLAEGERLQSLCPDEIELWAVRDPTGRLLAGGLLFRLNATCTHTFYLRFGECHDPLCSIGRRDRLTIASPAALL